MMRANGDTPFKKYLINSANRGSKEAMFERLVDLNFFQAPPGVPPASTGLKSLPMLTPDQVSESSESA